MNYQQPPQINPNNGVLDINIERGSTQFLLEAVTPTVEIDGYPQQRPWGRHIIEMYPGQHQIRVWFNWMGRSGNAELVIGIWPGQATMVGYKTPFLITSNGTLQLLGSRPLGSW